MTILTVTDPVITRFTVTILVVIAELKQRKNVEITRWLVDNSLHKVKVKKVEVEMSLVSDPCD